MPAAYRRETTGSCCLKTRLAESFRQDRRRDAVAVPRPACGGPRGISNQLKKYLLGVVAPHCNAFDCGEQTGFGAVDGDKP